MSAGTCKYCGCSHETPCAGGCSWANEDQTICSLCQSAADIAEKLVQVLGQAVTRGRRQLRQALPTWSELQLPEQQLLVMACRATVEAIKDALFEGIEQDGFLAGIELNLIAAYLLEKCPQELQYDGETLSATVIRLLDPHVGSRIVVPGMTV